MDKLSDDVTSQQRARLVHLAAWAAGEDVKRRLGLPSEWEQVRWFGTRGCGTTCCIAGKVALEDGAVPVLEHNDDGPLGVEEARELWRNEAPGALDGYLILDEWVYPPGATDCVDTGVYARHALGLTVEQAAGLFDGTNTLDDILRVVAQLLDVDLPPADVD